MRRFLGIITLACVLGYIPSVSAGPSAKKSDAGTTEAYGDETALEENPETVVTVPLIVVPVISDQGELLRYGYALIHLTIPQPLDRWDVEDKIHYIKDALIHEMHRIPNAVEEKRELDEEALKSRLMKRIGEIAGDRVGELVFKELAYP